MPSAIGVTRIVVTGSECTGKTTLARRLAEFFGVGWVPEFAREYAAEVDRPLTAGDVASIARGHLARADAALARAARSMHPMVIFDTDLVSTTVYAEHYYGSCPTWISESAKLRLAELYLLADIDVPWVADGIRDQPQARRIVHRRFVRRLEAIGASMLAVRGLGETRFQNALSAVRGWRSATMALARSPR